MGYVVTYLLIGVCYAAFNDDLKGAYTDRAKTVLTWPVDLYVNITNKTTK